MFVVSIAHAYSCCARIHSRASMYIIQQTPINARTLQRTIPIPLKLCSEEGPTPLPVPVISGRTVQRLIVQLMPTSHRTIKGVDCPLPCKIASSAHMFRTGTIAGSYLPLVVVVTIWLFFQLRVFGQ